ncbi:hypothetical protein T265_05972 [Opisthorchis viverrini]|uniref:Uncharacterized protein n=1 Tax=Opisthorchis viverrini TaxID=6198 RepID=A0A074ZHT3_OPIVI|nr:hypothetical protein T265_05972 [Opisthorchis viverrini]KER26838.1 hypothetical protein T265_05972 [Opisthorchis viverrini]
MIPAVFVIPMWPIIGKSHLKGVQMNERRKLTSKAGLGSKQGNGEIDYNNGLAVTPFQYLVAVPPEERTRAVILLGCPSLDSRSREAEVGFKPRTLRSANTVVVSVACLLHKPNGFDSPFRRLLRIFLYPDECHLKRSESVIVRVIHTHSPQNF